MSRNLLLATTLLATFAGLTRTGQAQPVTGLYVGAGGGANFMQREQVRIAPAGAAPSYGRSGFDTGYVALGSLGYGFGNGLRVEAEGDYRRNAYGNGRVGSVTSGREEKYGGMVNVLFDLDVGSPYIYPYIGGGAGYQRVDQRTNFIAGTRSAFVNSSDNGFAYQAIAGIAFPIPPVVGLSFTAEYRYFSVTGDHNYTARLGNIGLASAGQVRTRADFNHSLMLGLRYAFNVAPPAPEPTAAPSAPPAAQAARTYLVFFDWDRADLTPRARQVVAEAAATTTRVQVTRMEVNGYTDTSGTPRYNQALSLRRAQTVANELVRDGVPRQSISIQGYGESRLLVPTAAGVREPQNRRVEIILR